MGVRVRNNNLAGKTIKSMEYRVSEHGDKFTTLILIIFTDDSSIELTPREMTDGSTQIRMDEYLN